MTSPAFTLPTPLPLPSKNPPPLCHHHPPHATLSLPNPSNLHSDETKRKIGASVLRRAARRRSQARAYYLSMLQSEDDAQLPDPPSEPTSDPPRRRRRMSAESRAKISAALKGRAKSPEHRANLSKRFEGSANPMYGRKLSKESRAKISAAMSSKKKKKDGEGVKTSDDVLDDLREKAVKSRLLSEQGRRRSAQRKVQDQAEAEEIERILQRVASLDVPPENVVRMRRKREKEKVEGVCEACGGGGMVACPKCVGCFGVASERCEVCYGAGGVFCENCGGVGKGKGKRK